MLDSEQKIIVAELEKFLEKHEVRHVYLSVMQRIIFLVIAAVGLIAALAWDKALHHLFERFFHGDSLVGEIGYAALITVIAALVSVWLGRFLPSGAKTEKE
jgi:uncharacterized membrane protein